jgi:WD40 repeat protein/tetratricopeptide (TPR) repeat protein
MVEESQRYDVRAIRELLFTAFSAEDLRNLFYFARTLELRDVLSEFAPGDSLPTMVRKAVLYCDSRSLLGEMLMEVAEANPRKYQQHESRLYCGDAQPSLRVTLAEVAKQAARQEVERMELERQEAEAAERRRAEQAFAEQVNDLMAQGMARLREGEWWLASEAFRQVLALVPDHAPARASLQEAERQEEIANRLGSGQNYFRSGRWQEAIACFEAVLEIDAEHREASRLLEEARAQERARLEEEARQARDAQLREEVFQAERTRLFDEGCAAAQEKDWSKAIERFEAVLRIEPNYLDTADRLAQARARRDEARKLALARQETEARARHEAEAHRAELARQEAGARAKREEEARKAELFRLYYVACLAAWNRNWPKAIENFEALLLRDLRYRDAADRLQEVRALQLTEQLVALKKKQSGQVDWMSGIQPTPFAVQHLGSSLISLPKAGPQPPEDVLQRRQEIMAAGKSPSRKEAAGKPAAAPKPPEWQPQAELQGHTKTVEYAAFSPDGRLVVTASEDKTARVWETMTGKSLARMRGHSDIVWCAAFSPDGTLVVTASGDGRARLWRADTGKVVTELRIHAKILGMGWHSVLSAAFSPDGRLVATASGKVCLWAVPTGEMVAELDGDAQSAVQVAFSPDGKWLVAGGEDGTAWIREVATGRVVAELRGHTGKLQQVAFSSDGKRVITAGRDGTVRIWDAVGKAVRSLRVTDDFGAWGAALHPNGKWLLAAAFTNKVRVWDTATGKPVAVLRGHANHVVSVGFSSDGKWAVTGSYDCTARVWRVPAG